MLFFNAEWTGIQVVVWLQTWVSQKGSLMGTGILPCKMPKVKGARWRIVA